MEIKNLRGWSNIILWTSLLFYVSCSSSDDPAPVDCNTSTLAVSFTSSDPTSCGTSNGTITASATGGDGPYQFALDAQAYGSTSTFTGLGAGTYQLKAKDKNGCERTTTVILKLFGSTLASTVSVTTDSGCKTASGVLTITASGGTAPYSYKLNDGAASATNTFSSLAAGSYSVKITDNTGCSITQSVKILSGIKLSVEIESIINANCAVTGCHVANGGAVSFAILANIQSNAAGIKSKTQSGEMPKGGTKLPQAELDAIACWVDDGAPDN